MCVFENCRDSARCCACIIHVSYERRECDGVKWFWNKLRGYPPPITFPPDSLWDSLWRVTIVGFTWSFPTLFTFPRPERLIAFLLKVLFCFQGRDVPAGAPLTVIVWLCKGFWFLLKKRFKRFSYYTVVTFVLQVQAYFCGFLESNNTTITINTDAIEPSANTSCIANASSCCLNAHDAHVNSNIASRVVTVAEDIFVNIPSTALNSNRNPCPWLKGPSHSVVMLFGNLWGEGC